MNENIWLVTRITYEAEVGVLSLYVQTHNYLPHDANYLLAIMGKFGKVASWEPIVYSYATGNYVSGILCVYPDTILLARIKHFTDSEDTCANLSRASSWLNWELDKKREEHKKK